MVYIFFNDDGDDNEQPMHEHTFSHHRNNSGWCLLKSDFRKPKMVEKDM
jgi:hypothetical protein